MLEKLPFGQIFYLCPKYLFSPVFYSHAKKNTVSPDFRLL